jgi:hypothetical protein
MNNGLERSRKVGKSGVRSRNDAVEIERKNSNMNTSGDYGSFAGEGTTKIMQHSSFASGSIAPHRDPRFAMTESEVIQHRGFCGNCHQIYCKFKLEPQEKLIVMYFKKKQLGGRTPSIS